MNLCEEINFTDNRRFVHDKEQRLCHVLSNHKQKKTISNQSIHFEPGLNTLPAYIQKLRNH